MTINDDYEDEYYFELEQLLWKIINLSGVKISNLQRTPSPHLGYSGTMYYHKKGEGFNFVVDLDEEELNFIFQVYFPLKTDDKHIDTIFSLSTLANMIIKDEGFILPTVDNDILLFRDIPLYDPICDDYAKNSMQVMASIVYAFTPYFRVIAKGEYPFLNYAGGSAIAQAVSELIKPESFDIAVSDLWSDYSDYCNEKWYQHFRKRYSEIYRKFADQMAEQKRRKEHFGSIRNYSNMEPVHIIEYQPDYLEDVRKLLTELQKYIVSIDKDHLDCLHLEYREKMALVDLDDVENNNGKCYLAIKNQTVVGLIMGTIPRYNSFDYLDYRCPKSGVITELVVTESEMNYGAGNLLLSSMESYFRHMGCEYVKVGMFAYNTTAIDFYTRHHYHSRMYIAIKALF